MHLSFRVIIHVFIWFQFRERRRSRKRAQIINIFHLAEMCSRLEKFVSIFLIDNLSSFTGIYIAKICAKIVSLESWRRMKIMKAKKERMGDNVYVSSRMIVSLLFNFTLSLICLWY